MATSSISSLGLGSDGALSYDVIDQLRAVDEKAQISPIDVKITNNKTKQDDLSILTTLTASLKSVTSSLSDELSYLKRTTSVSNDDVSVTASSGSSIQDFSLHVDTLAQRDIYQSSSFALETSTFSSSTTTPVGTVVAPSVTTTEGQTAVVGVTESAILDFNAADMVLGDTLTIGGLTLTANGTINQAEALAAFAGLSSGATAGNGYAGQWSGTLTGFNSGAVSSTSLTFTSTTANSNVADLSVASSGSSVVSPSITTTDGVTPVSNVTESSSVSFNAASMSYGDKISIGGLTLTATGTMTQADVVAAFANLTSGATKGNTVANGSWSGTLAGFSSGAASGTSLTFSSITANTNVANLAVSATQEAGGTTTVPSTYTFSISIDGKTYDLDLTSGTTLSQLKDMITDETDGKVTASILNVGGTNPYKLVIKSADTGEDNAITFASTSISALRNLGLDSTSLVSNGNHLQTATDASFTYNGVSISRSTNTINDLVNGLSITLNEKQISGTTTSVSIKQDLTNVKTNLESLVTKYNDLMSNLTEATKYDVDTQTAGTFQGVSQITSLSANINRQLLGTDEFGRSILDYGITLNDEGILEFDASAFDTKVSEDAKDVEDFFRGSTTYSSTKYTGTSVAAGDLSFATGNLVINGINIVFSTTGNTPTANALALQDAINSAGISGIEALIGTNNNVYLQGSAGNDIEITGDTAKLTSIGFFATNVYSQSTRREGFFSDFNTMLANYITGDESILTLFESTLTGQKDSLTKERSNTVERLDKRYAIMATRFAAYDSIINKLNNQFKSLSMMIEQSYTNN
jgi:flagellar hook-associated protein 2